VRSYQCVHWPSTCLCNTWFHNCTSAVHIIPSASGADRWVPMHEPHRRISTRVRSNHFAHVNRAPCMYTRTIFRYISVTSADFEIAECDACHARMTLPELELHRARGQVAVSSGLSRRDHVPHHRKCVGTRMVRVYGATRTVSRVHRHPSVGAQGCCVALHCAKSGRQGGRRGRRVETLHPTDVALTGAKTPQHCADQAIYSTLRPTHDGTAELC